LSRLGRSGTVLSMRSLGFAFLLAIAATGCSKTETTAAGDHKSSIPEVTVAQVDSMLAKNECQAVDANGEGTRKKLGTLPGAVLLTDSEMFAPSELPADKAKTLVFYCANTQCGASHEAAEKALTAGHKNVRVMPEGIAGWVKAGKQTTKLGS